MIPMMIVMETTSILVFLPPKSAPAWKSLQR